jgi:hypothetical protein
VAIVLGAERGEVFLHDCGLSFVQFFTGLSHHAVASELAAQQTMSVKTANSARITNTSMHRFA